MYNYQHERPAIFKEENVAKITKCMAKIEKALANKEMITVGTAISGLLGSTWTGLAIVDYLCEQGFYRKLGSEEIPTQDYVIVRR